MVGLVLLLVALLHPLPVRSATTVLSSWRMSTSSSNGSVLSSLSFDDLTWLPVRVPTTVLGGLVQNGVYGSDLLLGRNLASVNASLFQTPWWFRTVFAVDPARQSRLLFRGINYVANVFVSGKLLARLTGTFRTFSVPLPLPAPGASRVACAVQVFRPHDEWARNLTSVDLAASFIDWAPEPPDGEMGLWQPVVLVDADVVLSAPFADTIVRGTSAFVSLGVRVSTQRAGRFMLSATVMQRTLSQTTTAISASEFDVDIGKLAIPQSALWWPAGLGAPTLHNVTFAVTDVSSKKTVGTLTVRLGFRSATGSLDGNGHRRFAVNGVPVVVLGGGWTPELLHQHSADERADYLPHFLLARHLGLNAIRLEGKFPEDAFYELADEHGIMLLPGLACCDAWQHWPHWTAEQFAIANASVFDQALRLRSHASALVFLVSSDSLPPVAVEQLYLSALKRARWSAAILQSAADTNSTISGRSGVKMSGPYSYVPPIYWSSPQAPGGAQGFLTEGGPGENPLSLRSAQLTFTRPVAPPDMRGNDEWAFHCGNPQGVFRNLSFFLPVVQKRLGDWTNAKRPLQAFASRSQFTVHETVRSMFEEYSARRFQRTTGVIFWMLNSAWPSSIWHLYDYFYSLDGAAFATRLALRPIHASLSLIDLTVHVTNSQLAVANATLNVRMTNLTGAVLFAVTLPVAVPANAGAKVFQLPPVPVAVSAVFVVRLQLNNDAPNDYFLPAPGAPQDVLNFAKSNYFRTPQTSFADLSALTRLGTPNVTCTLTGSAPRRPGWSSGTVFCRNVGAALAVFVQLNLDGAGLVLFDDNFFNVWPGDVFRTNVDWTAASAPNLIWSALE